MIATDILANGGTAIIIHDKEDDMKTDPTGGAGNRIACGVITDNPPVEGKKSAKSDSSR